MPVHHVFGAACVVLGVLVASGSVVVANWLVAFVAEVTARAIPERGHNLARAGANLLGLSYALVGIATLLGWRWLIVPLATLLVAELVYLPVRLARLGGTHP